jgi:hypothetical protein
MRKLLLGTAIAIGLAIVSTSPAKAAPQVSVEIGVEPDCPYGYYDVVPYACAPYGYYGPEWFVNGIFFGAGPWFHGPRNFHGHVNNRFHPDHGYKGPLPRAGERATKAPPAHFKGNEVRDGRGHALGAKR